MLTKERYENATKGHGRPGFKYRAEHRIIAEKYIGRKLAFNSEQVLHLNGLPQDNRPENLYVCDNMSHIMKIFMGTMPFPPKSNLEELKKRVVAPLRSRK